MLTHLSQSALQINIKRGMKLLSSCFHFQGTWPKPSVLGGRRLSTRRFLCVSVKSPPPLATSPHHPVRRLAWGKTTAFFLLPEKSCFTLALAESWNMCFPVPWLELLRKTSATSKLITEHKHPSLRPGLLWERLDAGSETGCRGRWGRPS